MTLRERNPEQAPVRLQAMQRRVQALYQQGSDFAQDNNLLNGAFEELRLALEQLEAAEQALQRQQSQWLTRQADLELESRRYKDLFDYAPAGYVVTGIDGAIRQANPAALALLQVSERVAIGRALALFIPEGQRRAFRNMLAELLETEHAQEWVVSMRSWDAALFEARLTARVLRGASGRPVAIYWLLRDIGAPSDE